MPNPEDQLEQKQPEGEKPLGPNGESALRKERERADELEKQLKALQAQFGDIARAFGVKSDKDASAEDLKASVEQVRRELAVERLARTHGITDEDDIAALSEVPNEATRAKLAARLSPEAKTGDGDDADSKQQTWPRPKPDATQGPKGDPQKPDPKPGMPRLSEAVTAALEAKN